MCSVSANIRQEKWYNTLTSLWQSMKCLNEIFAAMCLYIFSFQMPVLPGRLLHRHYHSMIKEDLLIQQYFQLDVERHCEL